MNTKQELLSQLVGAGLGQYRTALWSATLALALLLVGTSARAQGGWQPVDMHTTQTLRDAAFADSLHGWAVGEHGTLTSTTDGGAVWSPLVSNAREHLRGVAVSPSGTVVVVGEGGRLLRSEDGIQFTSAVLDSEWNLVSVVFSSDTEATIVGTMSESMRGLILHSVDAGRTWATVGNPVEGVPHNYAAIHFHDPLRGAIAGTTWQSVSEHHALVLTTTDGGRTWQHRYTSAERFEANAIARTTSDAILVLGTVDPDDAAGFFASDDGGEQWRFEANEHLRDVRDLVFLGTTNGVAVGVVTDVIGQEVRKMPSAIYTWNGGMAWGRETISPMKFAPSTVAVAGTTRVLAAGVEGEGAHVAYQCPATSIVRDLPDSATMPYGATMALSVESERESDRFLWYHNDVAIPGAVHRIYPIIGAEIKDSGMYRVDVISDCNTVRSNVCTLAVTLPSRLVAMAKHLECGATQRGETRDTVFTGAFLNGGQTSVRIVDVRIAGESSFFSIVGNHANTLVAPGASVDVHVRYRPEEVGTHWAALQLLTEGADNPVVHVSGSAGAERQGLPVLYSRRMVDFGVVDMGQTKDTVLPDLIVNDFAEPMTIDTMYLSGDDIFSFSLEGYDGLPIPLESGAGRGVGLSFSPSIPRTYHAVLVIGQGGVERRLPIVGVSRPTWYTDVVDYGRVGVGISRDTTLYFEHVLDDELICRAIDLQDGDFSLQEVNPRLPATVGADGLLEVVVRYRPTKPGAGLTGLRLSWESPEGVVVQTERRLLTGRTPIVATVEEAPAGRLQLRPIPADDRLWIDAPGPGGRVRISITDMFGRTVRTLDVDAGMDGIHAAIDIEDVPSGAYTVSLVSDGKRSTSRMVKR
ncbi:MAG: hypothetical protein J0I17_00515 ['Candidatus Kapabacteria' thiocyanatum]|uniref:Photosynthesis system II assembly factor Ycf48/Hcf136-like domain-containing protein n=1 Tax=Candidatus Kapaibacterium thiocyanatum TaxID=1895771 RepID=A0A1M3KW63_9BACT|nr:hypothetical protein ['Candidatus Kapabacteria' thiocyanatum]OJX56676.1 MAG: hypothetical protein BGO89_09035 ['Candidatus Kapabacteria' thiocyanatum]